MEAAIIVIEIRVKMFTQINGAVNMKKNKFGVNFFSLTDLDLNHYIFGARCVIIHIKNK